MLAYMVCIEGKVLQGDGDWWSHDWIYHTDLSKEYLNWNGLLFAWEVDSEFFFLIMALLATDATPLHFPL